MASDNRENRTDWVDTAKGLGIVLVVVGHVLRGLTAAHLINGTPVVTFVDAWIYSFHMPLFFFLSGLFLPRSATNSSLREFTSSKVRTIAYPYVVWSTITVLLKAALGPIPNTPRGLSDLLLIPYSPIEQFWFLYVLFVLALLFGVMFAFGLEPWIAIALALIIYPDVVALSLDWSVLHEVRTYAIYVAIGAFLGTKYLRPLTHINNVFLILALVLGFVFPMADIAINDQQRSEILCALSGIMGIVSLSLLLNRFGFFAFVSYLGTHALEIFVGHTMGSAAGRILLEHFNVRMPIVHVIVGVAAGLALPIAMYHAFKMIGFRFGFSLPKIARNPEAKMQRTCCRRRTRTVDGKPLRCGRFCRRRRNVEGVDVSRMALRAWDLKYVREGLQIAL